jgi:hypothetical protein
LSVQQARLEKERTANSYQCDVPAHYWKLSHEFDPEAEHDGVSFFYAIRPGFRQPLWYAELVSQRNEP